MPDTTGPSEGGTSSNRPLNVNEATVGNVKVTRMDVNTGEIKELQTDLLKEICDCIDDQTQTLSGRLEVVRKTLKDSIKAAETRNTKEIVSAIDRIASTMGSVGSGPSSPSERSENQGDNIAAALTQGSMELAQKLKESMDDMVVKLTQSLAGVLGAGGGDGEGGGGGGGGGVAGARQARRGATRQEEIIDEMEEGQLGIMRFLDTFREGAAVALEGNINRVRTSLFNLGESLTDLNGVFSSTFRIAKDMNDQMMEIVKSGNANLLDLFDDIGAGRQDILTTFNQMRQNLDEGFMAPIGNLGDSVVEVSKNMETARQGIIDAGFDMSGSFRNLEEMNQGILELVDINRRSGNMGELTDSSMQKLMAKQFEALKDVSLATGKTIPELLKEQRQDNRDLAALAEAGIISQEELQNLQPMMAILEKQAPAMADLIMQGLRKGGVETGMMMLAAENTQVAANLSSFQGSVESFAQRDYETGVQFLKQVENIAKGSSAAVIGAQEGAIEMAAATSQANLLADTYAGALAEQSKREQEADAGLDNTLTDLKVLLDKNLPVPLQNVATELAKNTIAIAANTAILAAKGLGSLIRGGGSLLRGAGNLAGNMAGRGGAVGRVGGFLARGAGSTLGMGGAGVAGAASSLAGVAGAGIAGYQLGKHLVKPGIDKAIQAITGDEDTTLGAKIFDWFGSEPEVPEHIQKEVEELKRKAAERKAARERGEVAADSTTVTPADSAATITAEQVKATDAAAEKTAEVVDEMTTQNEMFIKLLQEMGLSNEIATQIRDTIGVAGAISRAGDVTGPSPVQRKVPTMEGDPNLFEPSVSVDSPNRVSR